MNSSAPACALCSVEDVPEGGSKGFEIQGCQLFAVKKRGKVHVYHNRCPHLGLPLNWLPDRFLDPDAELIQCSSHGALFRIDNGLCVAGPCPGTKLRSLPCEARDGMIFIDPIKLDDRT